MAEACDHRRSADEALVAAARLMRLALPLLDRAGRGCAAAHLQRAIDDVDPAGTVVLSDDVVVPFLDGDLPLRGPASTGEDGP